MVAVSGEHRHEAYQLIFVGVLGAEIFSLGDILPNRIATINGDNSSGHVPYNYCMRPSREFVCIYVCLY